MKPAAVLTVPVGLLEHAVARGEHDHACGYWNVRSGLSVAHVPDRPFACDCWLARARALLAGPGPRPN